MVGCCLRVDWIANDRLAQRDDVQIVKEVNLRRLE